MRVLERIQTHGKFRSPTGGEPVAQLHEECLPVLLEVSQLFCEGPILFALLLAKFRWSIWLRGRLAVQAVGLRQLTKA